VDPGASQTIINIPDQNKRLSSVIPYSISAELKTPPDLIQTTNLRTGEGRMKGTAGTNEGVSSYLASLASLPKVSTPRSHFSSQKADESRI
jgi:hypothetical protein